MQDKHGGTSEYVRRVHTGSSSPSGKSARAVREDYNTENDRVHQSAHSSKEALENAPGPSRTSARLGVSITQSLQITAASLSGCIVQSNFRCASCVLKHLLLRYVKRAAAFHGKIFRQSLQRFREARDYFYPADLICHFYMKNIQNVSLLMKGKVWSGGTLM